jgi:hypothetical protein
MTENEIAATVVDAALKIPKTARASDLSVLVDLT